MATHFMQNILILDEPVNIVLLKKVLSRVEHCLPVFYSDIPQALNWLDKSVVDILVIGSHLSTQQALYFLEQRPFVEKNIPVIMITASSDSLTKSRAIQLGVTDFICVPLQKAELEMRIHAVIEARRHYLNYLQTQTLLQKSEYLHYVTAGIAHKFNNLLHIIQNCSDLTSMLLSQHTCELDVLKRHILTSCEKTHNAVEQGKALIEQIVCYSQRENDQQLTQDAIPFTTFITSQQPLLTALFDANTTFDIMCQDAQSVLLYSINSENLSKILRNLCLNANEAFSQTQDHRHVQLRAETATLDETLTCVCCHKAYSGRYLKLTIADNGMGIAERIMPSIFDPFFTTKGILHSGLGLTEVAGLVHNAQGFITYTSRALADTTFAIFLPFELAYATQHANLHN